MEGSSILDKGRLLGAIEHFLKRNLNGHCKSRKWSRIAHCNGLCRLNILVKIPKQILSYFKVVYVAYFND